MIRSVILMVLTTLTASALADDDKCDKLFHSGALMKCCKGALPKPKPEFIEMMKECHKFPRESLSCEREMCISNVKGYTTNGKLDRAKIKEHVAKDFDVVPALVTAIVEVCVDGDISKFGPSDMCDAIKMKRCTELQLIKTCPEWANDGLCEGVKEISAGCEKKFD